MDNVKKVEKALDQITKLSDQGYSVLTEAEKREPIKFKLDPKSLVYAKWEKIDPFDARNYQVSNNAFIAGNVMSEEGFMLIDNGRLMISQGAEGKGPDYFIEYDFNKISPTKRSYIQK